MWFPVQLECAYINRAVTCEIFDHRGDEPAGGGVAVIRPPTKSPGGRVPQMNTITLQYSLLKINSNN